jgi:hypothetical protein
LPTIVEDFSFATATGRRGHGVNATPDDIITFTTLSFRK